MGSKKKSQGSRLRTLILSGELVPATRQSELRGHQTAWRTSYRGHKCPSVTPRAPQLDLLSAPRPHEFHTQVIGCSKPMLIIFHLIDYKFKCTTFLQQISTAEPLPEFHGKLPVRTHVRSRSDATGLQQHHQPPPGLRLPGTSLVGAAGRPRLQLGDLMSGRAFDNGCQCLDSRHAAVNELRGESTASSCSAPRLEPQQEFLKVSKSIKMYGLAPY